MKQSDAQWAKYAQLSPDLVEIMQRSRIRDDKRPWPYKYRINDDDNMSIVDSMYSNNETVPSSNSVGVCKYSDADIMSNVDFKCYQAEQHTEMMYILCDARGMEIHFSSITI